MKLRLLRLYRDSTNPATRQRLRRVLRRYGVWLCPPPPGDCPMTSFKPAVIADRSGKWAYNSLRFATEAEALASAEELMFRWMLVTDIAAHPSDDPVNYAFVDGKNVRLEANV